MHSPTVRRSAAITGSLVATGAMLFTTAVGANAAPAYRSIATAQAATISIGGGSAYGTPVLTAKNTGGPTIVKSGSSVPTVGQDIIHAGAFATAVRATKGGQSTGCAGIVKPGGTVQVGSDGVTCTGSAPNAGGLTLDLGSALGTGLPVGVGSVKLTVNAVTSFASAGPTGFLNGGAKFANPKLSVCLGLDSGGNCVGVPVALPITFAGTPNEDLLPVLLTALTQSSQLGGLGSTIAQALKPVVSLRGNVQAKGTDSIKVTGLKVTLGGGGSVAKLNLAVSTAGPNHAK